MTVATKSSGQQPSKRGLNTLSNDVSRAMSWSSKDLHLKRNVKTNLAKSYDYLKTPGKY